MIIPDGFEPFRIKTIEPLRFSTREERERALAAAGFNVFKLKADDVLIDLLTDSGTGAMSAAQWASMLNADEAYAGSRSFLRFERVVRELTGLTHVLPTHQGRAAERILFGSILQPDDLVLNNVHFDTTRANIEFVQAEARDLVIDEGRMPSSLHPFKGNVDLEKLERTLEEEGKRVRLVMVTVTNNSGGGQPVSLENLRGVRALCDRFGKPLFLDACRFAENAYLIKMREPGQAQRSARDIAREMFSLADGCTMSAKKDGLANIGGFLALSDGNWAERARQLLILTEGFPTYGGLAGYDLEAIATGLEEVLDETYLRHRIGSVAYLAERLLAAGVPIVRPAGGHAVYVDARAALPHMDPLSFPGVAFANELFLEAGVRASEIGSLMFGAQRDGSEAAAPMELVRLALPRRLYTRSHLDYVAAAVAAVAARGAAIPRYRLTYAPRFLRHFTATFEPMSPEEMKEPSCL
jgi:tryptophanase